MKKCLIPLLAFVPVAVGSVPTARARGGHSGGHRGGGHFHGGHGCLGCGLGFSGGVLPAPYYYPPYYYAPPDYYPPYDAPPVDAPPPQPSRYSQPGYWSHVPITSGQRVHDVSERVGAPADRVPGKE